MDRPPNLVIDLNEAPSPPLDESPPEDAPSPPREPAPPVLAPPPLPPPPPQQPAPVSVSHQLRLQQEAREVVLRFHGGRGRMGAPFGAMGGMTGGLLPGFGLPMPPLPPPALHPGEAGWGHPPRPCASCGHQEIMGATMVCDSCERGFHPSCVRVWPPLLPPAPPPPGPPGAKRPFAAANEDWICPECEMRGARSGRWKLGFVPLDINAAPPEEPVAATVSDIGRTNVAEGAQLTHLEGVHLKNPALYDGMQFMPAFDLAHCLGVRQKFTSMDRDMTADGNVPQRSMHLRKRRDLSQKSTLPKFAENHELGNASIFMDPSFFSKAMEPSPTENKSSLKPPKFLVEKSNHRPHHRPVGLPVQYSDFFITSLGEIDSRTSYHNSYQIWPVGFTSYWHDRVTGSLFECEVCDGGNFGPLFKARRLPCSVFPLPEASTTLCRNVVIKADTIETKESSSLVEDTANDSDDNIFMLISDPSETNQDFLSCFANDMVSKRNSGCSNVPSSNMILPTTLSHSENSNTKEANLHDKIGEFTFEGTSPSSVWRMISCAMTEACEKMYKEHGHLVFFCTHSREKDSFGCGSGCQNSDDPCNPLNRFCSSYGPSIPQFIEKENDVESTCALLKEWLYQDRIGFDLEFVQEIVESLPQSRGCSNYQFLCSRDGFVSSLTVASGRLLVVHKNNPNNGDGMLYGGNGYVLSGPQDHVQPSSFSIRDLPVGKPIGNKLPPELAGDVFQILEFLGRFAEIIGLKEVPSVEQMEDELIDPWPICANQKDIEHYMDHTPPTNSPANVSTSYSNGESGLTTNEEMASGFIPVETFSSTEAVQDKLAAQTLGRCSGVVLPEIHLALLKVLFSELLSRVAIFVDPSVDPKESKSKRGRKKDADSLTKELKIDMLTANKLTWPELARRYILAVSFMSEVGMDLSDISSREGVKLFRCLQGDGGILCGALPGVVGMEKDALLLAEAEDLICPCSANEGNKVFMMDYKDAEIVDSHEEPASNITSLPDWVESLEPVRKLPTNVGTRIRKCVYEALEKKPPEWARKILEHSISKEVYKGNASGPTKKAVLSVLTEACRMKVPQNPEKPRKEKNIISISEAILKKCRIALRHAISADNSKPFGNLLGTTLTNSNENEDEGILGFPGMVSRPLDFRTIDIRLAMGSYRGSWEAFLDDVQEVIRNLHTAFGDRPDVLEMVVALSQNFESLYKTEVLDLVQMFDEYLHNENASSEINEELLDILHAANSMPKAPWEDGVCKVCGIDRDDDNVLLCDKCDSEYHTYCLDPPLGRVPRGNWYCPSCVSDEDMEQPDHTVPPDLMLEQKKHVGEESHAFYEALNKLVTAMEEKEYWELSILERVELLKFLCDEMLNTALIREHLDQCSDRSGDLQQKFRSWNYELKELKYKVEMRTSCPRQSRLMKNEHLSNSSGPLDNQQRGTPTASDHLEETERVNVGVNLNQPADGGPLGLSEQPSSTTTEGADGDAVGEGSQGAEKSLGSTSATNENFNMRDTQTAALIGESPEKHASTSSQDNVEARIVDNDADNNEMNALLNRISQLQDSISTVESQLTMSSLRRECLGRDSVGRSYWVIARPGKRPWLVADGSMLIPKYRDITMVNSYPQSTFDSRGWKSASVVVYESDEEIKCLVDWLRDFDPKEKELKDSILLWQRLLYLQGNFPHSDPPPPVSKFPKSEPPIDLLNTKAIAILEKKHGLQLDQDTSDISKRRAKKPKSGSEIRTYRCDCLEPIWPSRYHCLTCHETYLTSLEYEEHNGGKCNRSIISPSESKEHDEPKVKGTKSDTKEKDPVDHNYSIEPSSNRKSEPCPYDFEEICRKFITNDASKETVKEIGLIGSNGVPSFVPSPEPSAAQSQNKRHDDMPNDWTSSLEECQEMSAKKIEQEGGKSGQDYPDNLSDQMPKSRKPVRDSTSGEEASSVADKSIKLLTVNGGMVPESSLRPVTGRNFYILKQLKINLLDIDAALPEEALRASKSQQIRRRSWRAFVKDAESISQVVLATNLLEGMIKAEFLKNDWWYWSSFTAAIKTATVSSLALRIYTLDNCIMYMKDPVPNTEPADSGKPVNKGKRRRELESLAS